MAFQSSPVASLLRLAQPCGAVSAPRRGSTHVVAANQPMKEPGLPQGKESKLGQASKLLKPIQAIAEVMRPAPGSSDNDEFRVQIDNNADATYTVIRVKGISRPGLLSSITAAFRDLDVDVVKVG